MLASAVALCRPGRSRPRSTKLRNPAALTRQGAGHLQGEVRHEQGLVRHRGAPRLGAERRRSLLQPGQERLLRRRAVLPRDPELHGAVRHQRRPVGAGGLARAPIKDDPVKQSNKRGFVDVRDGRSEHAHARSSSSTSGTTAASTSRGSRRSVKWSRAWTSSTRSTTATAKARRAARARTGPHSERGQRVPDEGVPEARLHQDRDDRAVARHVSAHEQGQGGHICCPCPLVSLPLTSMNRFICMLPD